MYGTWEEKEEKEINNPHVKTPRLTIPCPAPTSGSLSLFPQPTCRFGAPRAANRHPSAPATAPLHSRLVTRRLFRPSPPESLLAADMARVLVVVLVVVVGVDGEDARVDRCGSDCRRGEEGGRKAALFVTGRGAAAAAVEEVENTRGR